MQLLLQDCTFIPNCLFWRGDCVQNKFCMWEGRFRVHLKWRKKPERRWLGWRHLPLTFTAACGRLSCLVSGEASPESWRCSCTKEPCALCLAKVQRSESAVGLTWPICWWWPSTSQTQASVNGIFFRAMAFQSMPGMYSGLGHTQNLFNVALWLLHSDWC